jgi:hypothetical protein
MIFSATNVSVDELFFKNLIWQFNVIVKHQLLSKMRSLKCEIND